MIEFGDSEGEVRVWGEINMLRYMRIKKAFEQSECLTRALGGLCVNSVLIHPSEVSLLKP